MDLGLMELWVVGFIDTTMVCETYPAKKKKEKRKTKK